MKVKDVMTTNVECVRPETTLQEAAAKMKSLNVGSLPVCEGDRPIGIVTDRDIVIRAIAEGRDPRTGRVPEVMTAGVVSVPDGRRPGGRSPHEGPADPPHRRGRLEQAGRGHRLTGRHRRGHA